jgi:sugar phosphate isomerase/epimerase
MTFLKRQLQPRANGVVELLGVELVRSAAPIDRCPESDEALRRYRDARRARQNQAELADQFASEYVVVLVGANSQERHAAAVIVAEAYEEARSLAQIELDLMAKVLRVSDRADRQMDIHDSGVGDEIRGAPGDYVQPAAHWREVAGIEQVSIGKTPGSNNGRADSVQPWLTPSWRRAGVGRTGPLCTPS